MQELDILREAGLTLYKSKAYRTIRSQSSLTTTEVAHRSGAPQSKIYEVLYALESLGLVKRHLNKEKAAEIDERINQFLSEMKSHHVTLKAFGRGRLKQVWTTNGTSLTSLVDRRIKLLDRTKGRLATYEAFTNS